MKKTFIAFPDMKKPDEGQKDLFHFFSKRESEMNRIRLLRG